MPTLCLKCSSTIKSNAVSICCTKCNKWCHKDCSGLTTEKINFYQREFKKDNGAKWLCFFCENSPTDAMSNSPHKCVSAELSNLSNDENLAKILTAIIQQYTEPL